MEGFARIIETCRRLGKPGSVWHHDAFLCGRYNRHRSDVLLSFWAFLFWAEDSAHVTRRVRPPKHRRKTSSGSTVASTETFKGQQHQVRDSSLAQTYLRVTVGDGRALVPGTAAGGAVEVVAVTLVRDEIVTKGRKIGEGLVLRRHARTPSLGGREA